MDAPSSCKAAAGARVPGPGVLPVFLQANAEKAVEEPLAEGGGLVAASSLIDSGFGFGYFRAQHVGATAWYLMAAARSNPMQYGELR